MHFNDTRQNYDISTSSREVISQYSNALVIWDIKSYTRYVSLKNSEYVYCCKEAVGNEIWYVNHTIGVMPRYSLLCKISSFHMAYQLGFAVTLFMVIHNLNIIQPYLPDILYRQCKLQNDIMFVQMFLSRYPKMTYRNFDVDANSVYFHRLKLEFHVIPHDC